MSELTKLQCQNCSAILDHPDNYQNTVQCKYCGSTYGIEKKSDAQFSEILQPRSELKPVKPDDILIDKQAGSIQFTRVWRKKSSYILLAMAAIWLIVIFNQLADTWLEGANASILFLLVFVAAGGMLLYRALSELFNRSILSLNKQTVSLSTTPFKWKGDFNHPMNKIRYFEIVPPPGPTLSPSTRSFRLCAITDDDMRLTLLHKIKKASHAIYLLREVNRLANKP